MHAPIAGLAVAAVCLLVRAVHAPIAGLSCCKLLSCSCWRFSFLLGPMLQHRPYIHIYIYMRQTSWGPGSTFLGAEAQEFPGVPELLLLSPEAQEIPKDSDKGFVDRTKSIRHFP